MILFSEFFALAGSGESERIHRLSAHNLTPTTRSCLLYLGTGDYGQELRTSGGDAIGENKYMGVCRGLRQVCGYSMRIAKSLNVPCPDAIDLWVSNLRAKRTTSITDS
ncbi:hypothetical protein DFH09DRAFT_1068370 [Mycena vulgaris]|nr:hypothetical protein DFH09DRAFT_1068370 [Mycena vulgaris]